MNTLRFTFDTLLSMLGAALIAVGGTVGVLTLFVLGVALFVGAMALLAVLQAYKLLCRLVGTKPSMPTFILP